VKPHCKVQGSLEDRSSIFGCVVEGAVGIRIQSL
jgi:hypothetical protein